MNVSEICFVFDVPPVKSYYYRYEMDELVKNGKRVLVFDVSGVTNKIHSSSVKNGLLDEIMPVCHISSIRDFKEELSILNDPFVILTMPFTYVSTRIYSLVCHYKYGIACNVDYFIPTYTKSAKSYLESFSLKKFKESLFHRIPRKMIPIRKADVVFTCFPENRTILDGCNYYGPNTKIEYINTFDYYSSKKEAYKDKLSIQGDYCVFIDEFFPLHPDLRSNGISIDPDEYYREIESFFHNVEKALNVKIIIAAHPKSNYESFPQYLKGFEKYKFHTPKLISNAKYVIAHESLAISYAIIFDRPFIMISTDSINNIDILNDHFTKTGNEMKHKIVNISGGFTGDEIIEMFESEKRKTESGFYSENKYHYSLDKKKYDNADMTFSEIVLRAISEI